MLDWMYVTACVVGPAVWGVCMYFLFNAVDRRRQRARRDDLPPADYSI